MYNTKEPKPTITATELKSNLGMYLDKVMNEDEEFVITKNGRKAIRLSPYITDADRYFVVKEKAVDYMYGGKKVSYEEFMEIYENSELRMEFINGEIIILGSPSVFHQKISVMLLVQFNSYTKGKKCDVFHAPFDVHFFKKGFKDPDVMQPDILIACDTDTAVNERGRYMGTPTLVVEIPSPSTRSRDMVDKLNTYMISGVKEFWVVDPGHKTILVYSFNDCQIDNYVLYKLGETVSSAIFEGLTANTEDIFES